MTHSNQNDDKQKNCSFLLFGHEEMRIFCSTWFSFVWTIRRISFDSQFEWVNGRFSDSVFIWFLRFSSKYEIVCLIVEENFSESFDLNSIMFTISNFNSTSNNSDKLQTVRTNDKFTYWEWKSVFLSSRARAQTNNYSSSQSSQSSR